MSVCHKLASQLGVQRKNERFLHKQITDDTVLTDGKKMSH